ncbi:MAG: 3'-5' exonuclease [Bacteroidia bacterium]|nr:3'-5' exonuclease [Bacteroidia bacterium]
MNDFVNLEQVLFIDIETVPIARNYADLDEKGRLLWDRKVAYFRDKEADPSEWYSRAGIYAEFGKVIVISCGYFVSKLNDEFVFRVKSFCGDNEYQLLHDFIEMLKPNFQFVLCAHNGKEFDFPFLARRILINGLKLPKQLNNHGKKPWEIPHLDTMELWKFGDFKSYTSLDTLTYVFGLPSPKDDIDGSMVGELYYSGGQLSRIVSYCEMDVVSVARIFQCYRGENPLKDQQIERVE